MHNILLHSELFMPSQETVQNWVLHFYALGPTFYCKVTPNFWPNSQMNSTVRTRNGGLSRIWFFSMDRNQPSAWQTS